MFKRKNGLQIATTEGDHVENTAKQAEDNAVEENEKREDVENERTADNS